MRKMIGPMGNAVEDPIDCNWGKVVQASEQTRLGKALPPLDLSLDMIAASREVESKVMVESCKKVLDRLGMPDEA